MAGKQFSFFLGREDQLVFENALHLAGDVSFLKIWPKSSQPEVLPKSRVLAMGEEILDLLIAREADLPEIVFRPIQGRDVFSSDQFSAPVIEFGRCYVTDRYIRAGRLYRVDKYWNDNRELVSKPAEFIEWAERVYKFAKASLTKIEQGCYAGRQALDLRKSGVALEGLDIEVGSIKD
jgi:hypothetical protein